MANFRYGAAALGLTFAAIIAAPAFASVSAAVCSAEGGDAIKVQGGDFCLVPIRPAEYAGPEYDGNQLGIVDCPGDKISDGAYCMAPITGGAPKVVPEASPAQFEPSTSAIGDVTGSVVGDSTPSVGSLATSAVLDGGVPSTGEIADVAIDAAKDAATDAIQDQAKKQTTGLLGGLGK